MKAWMNKLGGVLLASLLTGMLNGKAYATDELPSEPPATEISEPLAAPMPEALEATSVPASAEAASVTSTGSAVAPSVTEAAPAAAQAAPVADAASAAEASAAMKTSAAVEPAAAVEPSAAMEPASAEVQSAQIPEEETPVELPEASVTGSEAFVADTPEAEVSAASGLRTAFPPVSLAAAPADTLSLSGTETEEQEKDRSAEPEGEDIKAPTRGSEEGKDEDGGQTVTTVFSHNEDGSYTLVNHTGSENLSAEGDITVLAAGLNHISSISGSGTVRIAGTGILLVDSLEGNLELLTFTDIYEEGSAAVFVKQNDGTYLLKNGSVPGILDEEYTVEGVTLVMPESTSLHLIGTGAKPVKDEEGNVTSVTYYHGTEHGCKTDTEDEFKDAVEITGKLTIAQQAELIIQKGASILMENLKSVGFAILQPELNVMGGGTLTVEEGGTLGREREDEYGTIIKDGLITVSGEPGTLSGSGSITADQILVKDPGALNTVSAENPGVTAGSEITFSANELLLEDNSKGSSTVKGLKIKDCKVYVESSAVTVSGLSNAGDSTVVLPNASKLGIAEVDGTLHLSQREYYNSPYGEDNTANYSDSYAQTLSGDISGSGTICLDSGIYIIPAGTTLSSVGFSTDVGGLLYDYASLLTESSQSPLHMKPADAVRADANQGKVPVVAARLHEIHNRDGSKTVEIQETVNLDLTTLTAVKDSEGVWTLQLSDLRAEIQEENSSSDAYWVVVEVLCKDEGGILHTDFYALENLPDNLPADDVCLLRVSYVKNAEPVAPAGNAAQTGTLFTGSGILGGSGAGSVTIGNATRIENYPDLTPDPGPQPDPDPKPDPVPLAATVEEAPEQGPLIWVEVAPVIYNDAATSAEAQYVVLALEGEKTLEKLGGTANVSMEYALPEKYAGKQLYVVFRNEDGTLTALRASWSKVTGLLRFLTDRLGTFTVVGFDFVGEEFSGEFYAALEALPELKNLAYADYSPV